MRAMPNGLMARQLELLFRRGAAPQEDRALLEWFVSHGDEAAFEAIVNRHGPMVRGVCLRLLGSPHDADDAFQATFLVLVQKARSLRDADRLGPWLYGVATRVATRARVRAASRRDRFGVLVDDPPSRDEGASSEWLDVRPILDAELGGLPAKYRDVLVICLLEGSTAEEAARQLSCPVGTVKSRLARGREALRARLTSRGLAPAVVLSVVAGSAKSAIASVVSQSLLRTTLQTIAAFGSSPASLSPAVVALTRGVAPSMFTKSSIMAVVAFGGLALSGLGVAAWIKTPVQAQEPASATVGSPVVSKPDKGAEGLRRVSNYHLRGILLAMNIYSNKDGHFPPAAIYSKDGKALLSWRVALLPYLDEQKLFDEFHKDEPWDSPHNIKLMARMPAVFTTPHAPTAEHSTRFLGYNGKGAFFEGTEGVKLEDITDGTGNTIAVSVSKETTFWTTPHDLPFVDGLPLRPLDNTDPKGTLLGMIDGSTRYLAKDAKGMPQLLSKLITRNGGEIIEFPFPDAPKPDAVPSGAGEPKLAGTLPAGTAMTPGLSPPPIAPALEQRLQRLEDKLDLVLRRLDALAPATSSEKPK